MLLPNIGKLLISEESMVSFTSALSVWRRGASPVTSTFAVAPPTGNLASTRYMIPASIRVASRVNVANPAFLIVTEYVPGIRLGNRYAPSLFLTVSAVTASGTSVASTVAPATARSEEHTSELQSRSDLVCRLLLEK